MAFVSQPQITADEQTVTLVGGVMAAKTGGIKTPGLVAVSPATAALGATTVFFGPYGTAASATEADNQAPSPKAQVVYGFTNLLNAAVGAGRTLVVRLRVNGANVGDALTVLPGDGITPKSVAFAAAVNIAKGDKWCYSGTGDGAATIAAGTECSAVAEVGNP